MKRNIHQWGAPAEEGGKIAGDLGQQRSAADISGLFPIQRGQRYKLKSIGVSREVIKTMYGCSWD